MTEPQESAVVIVVRRDGGGEPEVLMGLRSRDATFFPGHWAFPGGRLEPHDQSHDISVHALCGARELLEETGVAVPAEALHYAGVRVTPPFHPQRFRTEFFVAAAPADVALPATPPSPRETEELRFLSAREALSRWERGEWRFPPPLPPLLRAIIEHGDGRIAQIAHAIAFVNEMEELTPRLEFVPGVWMVPVRSRTLGPATHTNVWMPGGERFVVVDPGSDDPDEVARLVDVIFRRKSDTGAKPEAILLTHQHADHVAGAGMLADVLRLPIRAHRATAEKLGDTLGVEVRGDLGEGMTLDLGGLTLAVHHTPGHAPGHVVLRVPERGATIVGDMLSGFSTIVIDPHDDGDLAQYLASLRRLLSLDPGLLLPAHGPPLPAAAIRKVLEHRAEREQKIVAALGPQPRAVDDIVGAAYDGEHPPLSDRQALAHLIDLERRGIAVRADAAGQAWGLA